MYVREQFFVRNRFSHDMSEGIIVNRINNFDDVWVPMTQFLRLIFQDQHFDLI